MPNKLKSTRLPKVSPSQIQFNGPARQIQSEDPFARDGDVTTPLGSPPALVIRATSDYEAKHAGQLSFQAGEFFHVTDVFTDLEGASWFQAENPLNSVQGIVPCTYFRKYGPSRPSNLRPIEKGSNRRVKSQLFQVFARGKGPIPLTLPAPNLRNQSSASSESSQTAEPKPSISNTRYQSLFGTMKYTFTAERPDELSARYGEPVIIMAHSAEEWFVVKPIGRLGGPGFIPASYIEIQEIQTCRVLSSEQGRDLIRRSVIPTVEEWKERVAHYKACSITLGVITGSDSVSLNTPPRERTNPLGPGLVTGNYTATSDDQGSGYHTTTSAQQDPGVIDWRKRQAAFIQCAQEDEGLSLVEEEEDDDLTSKARIMKRYGTLQKVNVTSFHREQGNFWYQVHAHFQHSDVGRRRRALVLYRLESHIETLESDLRSEFQSSQTLPKLTSSPPPADEMACARRMEELRDYFDEFSGLPESIRTSEAICEFLSSRQGDMELDDSDGEAEKPFDKSNLSNSQLKPPTLQLPAGANKPFSTAETLRQALISSQRIELSDDVRSWITSCDAASPNGFDFSVEEPSYSTQPSSIDRSSSPSLSTKSHVSSLKSDVPDQPTSSHDCDSE
ncbi:hypothetical protein PGT21_010921 [Puccinia graminis f. sp. tritici]|uniref:SH3 domain-containing protein n=2 Tax=Puccinia graminis f. sp. tritici TaxID=56615 RepID=E3KS58_PUCGT|nr:uncharacterized protein PGTG_13352 [Puccinia graminis f. sp. tritici CRL 75-36-700-3]EFP87133.2 hypothetical protein PGTG_13352 [Puccinia graminis f. sp. tritici CRL 75-36-700-3]KAA1073399.1 hypothetical protein PGT21_010921 [Puccinia graminis f. sp. tritici]